MQLGLQVVCIGIVIVLLVKALFLSTCKVSCLLVVLRDISAMIHLERQLQLLFKKEVNHQLIQEQTWHKSNAIMLYKKSNLEMKKELSDMFLPQFVMKF